MIGHDSARWLIEAFHKAWKSGCKTEERNLQTFENIERMMSMTAPIAVWCVFSEAEWMCLWLATEKKKPPQQIPTMKWAYYALAKMVGWIDSQKTGRVGLSTLWEAWTKLREQVIGFQVAFELMKHMKNM